MTNPISIREDGILYYGLITSIFHIIATLKLYTQQLTFIIFYVFLWICIAKEMIATISIQRDY